MLRENNKWPEKEAEEEAEILKDMVQDMVDAGEVGSYEEADRIRNQERLDKEEEKKENPELKSLLLQAEDAIADAMNI